MHVYPGLLAVIDMEHKNAGYTLIKLSQEHMLAPFFSQVWLKWSDSIQFICINFALTTINGGFQEGKSYDYLPV